MKKEYIMASITIFLWATLPPMTKLILRDFPSMTLLYYSSIIASIALVIILIITKKTKLLYLYTYKDLFPLTLLGFIGEFLYSALYYIGLTLISSQDACILNYLWPIIAIIFSSIIFKEKITMKKISAFIISFIGIIIIMSKGTSLHIFSNLTGSFICILAALCYGLFNVLNKLYGKDQWINMTYYFILTTILSGITCHITKQIIIPNTLQWLGIIWLGLFIDAIGIVIWAIALQSSEVSHIVNLAYVTPVLSMIISTIVINEPLNIYSCIGLFMIIGSLFIQKDRSH